MLNSCYHILNYQTVVSEFIRNAGSLKMTPTTYDFLLNIQRRRVSLQRQLHEIVTRNEQAIKLMRELLNECKYLRNTNTELFITFYRPGDFIKAAILKEM
jgi:hypothetical protein